MKNHAAKIAGIALLAGLAFGGFGCSRTQTITEDGVTYTTRGNFDEKSGTGKVTYTDEDGVTGTIETRGAGERPPDGWPKDFPIMRGFTVLNYSAMQQKDGAVYGGEWSTKASIGDVYGYYKEELSKNSWTIQSTSTYGDSSFITFSKKADARYSGTLSMEKEPDGNTSVTMVIFFVSDLNAIYGE